MSPPSQDPAVYTDVVRACLLGGMVDAVADPSAATSTAITHTYTTDNIAYRPDGSLTIADGDAISVAELHQYAEELIDQLNKLEDDMVATRTAVAALIGSNVGTIARPAALTSKTRGSATRLISITFTTDNPAITADGAHTIADGDLTTAAELLAFFEEANCQAAKLRDDVSALWAVADNIISQRSFTGISALPATVCPSGFITLTWTTDKPAITPDGAITIADGDAITAAERNAYIMEIDDEHMELTIQGFLEFMGDRKYKAEKTLEEGSKKLDGYKQARDKCAK